MLDEHKCVLYNTNYKEHKSVLRLKRKGEMNMKTTGIVRGIDSLGRIVLPKELRTNMHIDKDSKLEIFVEGEQIILKKHRPAGSCDYCGALAADKAQYEGYCICPACRAKIAAV